MLRSNLALKIKIKFEIFNYKIAQISIQLQNNKKTILMNSKNFKIWFLINPKKKKLSEYCNFSPKMLKPINLVLFKIHQYKII